MLEKPIVCLGCPINEFTEGFVPPQLTPNSNELIVAEAAGAEEAEAGVPLVGGAGKWFNAMLAQAKIPRSRLSLANVLSCRPRDNVFPTDEKWEHTSQQTSKEAVNYCIKHHLSKAINFKRWQKITTLGGKPLEALTGRAGVLEWRGSPLPLLPIIGQDTPVRADLLNKSIILPTLHPAFLMRQRELTSVCIRDLRKPASAPPEFYSLWGSLEELQKFSPRVFAFDLEWDPMTSEISHCGFSNKMFHANVWEWSSLHTPEFERIFSQADTLIGHNIVGADLQYFLKMGWKLTPRKIYDTILMQHLIQPDMRHGLPFVASVFTKKVFWKGKDPRNKEETEERGSKTQWKTWNSPNAIPRELGGYGGCTSAEEAFRLYNARDNDAEFQILPPILSTLEKYNLVDLYENVSLPLGFLCADLGAKGIKIDHSKFKDIRENISREIEELDKTLPKELKSKQVPINILVDAPPNTFKTKPKKCTGSKKNPHDLFVVDFTSPEQKTQCPYCEKELAPGKMSPAKKLKQVSHKLVRPWASSPQVLAYAKSLDLKEVRHRKTKELTAGKDAQKVWARSNEEFAIVGALKEKATLLQSFFKDGLNYTDRMYFNLLVFGTSEGRLSSTAQRQGIDLNVQNIPEEAKIFLVPDSSEECFVKFDISQGENLLRALFSKDYELVEKIRSGKFDEHSETAQVCFEQEVSKKVNKHLRDAGKIINHGIGYGATWKEVQRQLELANMCYTAARVKEMMKKLENSRPLLTEWQNYTISLAKHQGYLRNPFGRIRWFQTNSIATQALAFGPASTLADCVLRMMLAMHEQSEWCGVKVWECLDRLGVRERCSFQSPSRMVTQVHDEISAHTPKSVWEQTAKDMKRVMTQPWAELDGFSFNVDGKVCFENLGEGEEICL